MFGCSHAHRLSLSRSKACGCVVCVGGAVVSVWFGLVGGGGEVAESVVAVAVGYGAVDHGPRGVESSGVDAVSGRGRDDVGGREAKP